MLKFDQIPPTIEGTELDPSVVCTLAYGLENRCINGIAEVCASIVIANTADIEVIKGIGAKAGRTIAASRKSKYPEDDGGCFTYRYDDFVMCMLKGADKNKYRELVREAREIEDSAELTVN